MGKPLVYCNTCGSRLSDQDFASGRAHVDDFVSYCTKCKPSSSGKIPTQPAPRKEKSPTRTPPKMPPAPLPPATVPPPSRLPIYIGAGALAAVIVIVLIISLMRGESEAPPSKNSEPPPVAAKADVGPSIKLLEDLLTASKDMDKVVQRCDEFALDRRGGH